MGFNLAYVDGQTPLNEEELDGLLIQFVTTKQELDEFEQQNIEEAFQWLMGRSLKAERILTEKFILDIHKRMYGHVWKWAGTFRTSQKNLGVDHWLITTELRQLLDDALYWHQNAIYKPDEFALRFKHRIVCIHCFSNGNGRHSRLIADIIIEKIFARKVFSWGANNLSGSGLARAEYLKAIKAADLGHFNQLLKFSRQ